ncbi:hypothetical protein ACSNOK_00745 [Streptomyces sp. URMC 126]|uniref:hypothetical protein n=1 Tax=Streptomyces sp. URMC 126 TaxID=3423401 RepID=UPI003F1D398A
MAAPAAEVDDFLPPGLRMPSREEIAGIMMPDDKPLVIDSEMRLTWEGVAGTGGVVGDAGKRSDIAWPGAKPG